MVKNKKIHNSIHVNFQACIKSIEDLDDTDTGSTEDDEYNTIDGIHLVDKRPVEIKQMGNFGKDNHLDIHISLPQIKALKEGGMVYTGGWRVRQGIERGPERSNEGELIIGGIDGEECHYVKIPYHLLGDIFTKDIYMNTR